MRCSTVVTAFLLAIPLFASLFGLMESASFLRPAKLHLSQFAETDTHLDKPLPPLLAALLAKVRTWERPGPASKYVPMSDTANYTLLVDRTNQTVDLLAVDHSMSGGEVRMYRFPVGKEGNIAGKHWEKEWEMKLPGEVSAQATCADGSCFCVAYSSEAGVRIRYFPGQLGPVHDDFELPGAGQLQALTVSNSSIGFQRALDWQPFTVLQLVHEVQDEHRVVLLKEDSAWVLADNAVQDLPANCTVIGLQYVYAVEADWMIVTSTTPPDPDSYLYTHLYYSVNHSEWLQFSDFEHNLTFPAHAHIHCSYSVSDLVDDYLSASVSLVASSHTFLSYSWQ